MEPPQVGDYWTYDGTDQWECYEEGGQLRQRQINPPQHPPVSPPVRRYIPSPVGQAWRALIGGPVGGGTG